MLIPPPSHAWLESAQFSSFGPKVPTLQYVMINILTILYSHLSSPSVLMQWAEGGR